MKSLKQLALLAFVRAVEEKKYRGDAGDYLQLALGETDLMRAVVALLARRKKLSSSTLRPFLHVVTSLDLSSASPSLRLEPTLRLAPHLTSLAVRSRLTDAVVPHLPGTLTVLDCSCCPRLTAVGLVALVKTCPRLVSLSCGWSHISSLDPLAGLADLDMLDASRLLHLERASVWPTRLKRLVLGGSGLQAVDCWPEELELLDLSDCCALRSCAAFPATLRELAAARVSLACDEWLERAAGACERLAWLDVSGTACRTVPWKFSRLQSLLLERCSFDPCNDLSFLSVLSLSGCVGVDLSRLASRTPALTSLCLSSTSISDSQLLALLSTLPLLRLDVSFCQDLSDEILSGCERLVLLRIYGCPNVTLAALKAQATRCPGLRLCAPTSE